MDADLEAEVRRAVTRHLVGNHTDLYLTSFHFKSSIDQLVNMLPSWGDGLAIAARISDTKHKAAVEAMERGPGPSFDVSKFLSELEIKGDPNRKQE